MSQLKDNKTCTLLEQYFTYLPVVDKDQFQSAVNSNPIASMFGR